MSIYYKVILELTQNLNAEKKEIIKKKDFRSNYDGRGKKARG